MSRISEYTYWAVAFSVYAVLGVALNPLVLTNHDRWYLLLAGEGILALLLLLREAVRHREHIVAPDMQELEQPSVAALVLVVAVQACWMWLFRRRFFYPELFAVDDWRHLRESADWQSTLQSLFVPFNEHVIPFARLLTYILTRDFIPWEPAQTFAVAGAIMFTGTFFLLFHLIHRVSGDERAAVVASAFFSISLAFDEILMWYSASLWLIPTMLLLASLMGAEAGSRRGYSVACVGSLLGPWCFSLGVLVGPVVSVWLFLRKGTKLAKSLVPFGLSLFSVAILLVLLSNSFASKEYTEAGGHGYRSFDAVGGVVYSTRLSIDRLLLTNLGWRRVPVPEFVVFALFGGILAISLATLRRKPTLAQAFPALVIAISGYAITMPFRTWSPYGTIVYWTRYQLIPQVAMTMVLGIIISILFSRRKWNAGSATVALVVILMWTMLQEIGLPITRR